jgi:hypothetical protein
MSAETVKRNEKYSLGSEVWRQHNNVSSNTTEATDIKQKEEKNLCTRYNMSQDYYT